MDEFMALAVALMLAAGGTVGGLIFHQTVWKRRRRRQLERDHFRKKLR